MKYVDFAIKIEPKKGNRYPVIVLQSPAGESRSSLKLPFKLEQVGDILASLGNSVRGAIEQPIRDLKPIPAAHPLSAGTVGKQLFSALFSGSVRVLLDQSLGMIHGKDEGLRIKIHIDPEDPSLAQLASLPWELLYREETREWLNLSRLTPIVRYLDVQRPHTPLELQPPLRILVVVSQPKRYDPLDLSKERAQIESTWATLEGVEVEFLEAATLDLLRERLGMKACHVLHYMGHGGFDERTGRGALVMEDEQGDAQFVDGPTLGILLRDLPSLRLVLLNACETAKLTKEKGQDPFAGVASSLVMAGIPAVVAMQFPISDEAAIAFARQFYRLLARGESVDAAVAEGRREIRFKQPDTLEWGTPVLFMRAAEGVIFRVAGAPSPPPPVTPVAGEAAWPAVGSRQEQLAALFHEARGLVTSEPRRVVEILSEIRREQPQYPGLSELELRAKAELKLREARRRWVEVPAGPFLMGSRPDRPLARSEERPPHDQVIANAFLIGRYPVTNAEFARFIEGSGYKKRELWTAAGWQWKGDLAGPERYGGEFDLPDHPVVGVSWHEAVAYCRWLTEQLRTLEASAWIESQADPELRSKIQKRSLVLRLPTEAEWEKAARGEHGREWPWGDTFDPARANTAASQLSHTTAVGRYSPAGDSPYGCSDMAGNVWEWCQSLFRPYPYRIEDGREGLDEEGPRVVRGGNCGDGAIGVRCAFRSMSTPDLRDAGGGFRVVVAPAP